jgi:AcrR family transcriptional regulator
VDGPTRERIIEAATSLFARQGYYATGVAEIADAVGLGRGALYHHIRSKENLLFEISSALVAEMVDSAQAVLEQEVTGAVKLHRLSRDLLQNLAAHRSGWTVSLYESRALSAPRRAELVRLRDQYEHVWAEVLAECQAEGLTGPVSAIRRRGIVGLLNSTYLWLDRDGRVPIAAAAEEYVDLILNGLRSRPAPDAPDRDGGVQDQQAG